MNLLPFKRSHPGFEHFFSPVSAQIMLLCNKALISFPRGHLARATRTESVHLAPASTIRHAIDVPTKQRRLCSKELT